MPALKESQPAIVIIGAGVGGLIVAIALKRQHDFHNFVIYEKANGIGGTWRDNIYPGCSSDSPIHFFSLSTDLNPEWDASHGSSYEIRQYWWTLAEKYGLLPHIVFNTIVTRSEWDAQSHQWRVGTRNVETKNSGEVRAEIVISALGILEAPRWPRIEGLERFKGRIFHSAKWDKNLDLRGKKVAVIGNGASATQLVPCITREEGISITQFARTPNWLLPNSRSKFSKSMKWMFRNVPFFMRFWRILLFLRSEIFYFTIFSPGWLQLQDAFKRLSQKHIRAAAPAKYADWLVPQYSFGCKRILWDSDYLWALNQPQLELYTKGIERVTEKGIRTRTGDELPFDVIILATGFNTDDYPIEVRGSKGRTIQDYYDSQNGPKAYLGTTIPDFPNFLMVAGPNVATGHTSVIYTSEVQADYMMQMIDPILKGAISSFEVKLSATDAYNDTLRDRLSRSVFYSCLSWYRKDGNGRVTSIFPGASTTFWWWLRKPNWNHYNVERSAKWVQYRRGLWLSWTWKLFKRTFVFLGLTAGLGYLALDPIKLYSGRI